MNFGIFLDRIFIKNFHLNIVSWRELLMFFHALIVKVVILYRKSISMHFLGQVKIKFNIAYDSYLCSYNNDIGV